MAIQFSNLASTTLASGVSSSATSVSVTSASLFPTLGGGDYFYATLGAGTGSEIVKVTAISGTTFTVIRGQDGTTAVSHSAGVQCALRVTAAALEDLRDATDNDTTYSVQDGELSQNNFTNADHSKLDGIATSANNYSHPSAHSISFITGLQTALDGKVDDSQVLTNVPSGALFTDTNTVYSHPSAHAISFITGLQTALDGKVDDSQVLTNVPSGALFTDTNTTYSVQDGELSQNNFTNADHTKLDGIATSANNYVLPSGIATETYVGTQISNLVDSSPATLNTLNELAAALGDDPNFATTVSTSIGTKLPLAGGSMSGTLTMGSNAITGTGTINSGAITAPSIQSPSGLFHIKRSSDGANALDVYATGEVVVASNYFFVTASQGAYFSATTRFRGNITNDTGTNVTVAQPLSVSGAIKISNTEVISSGRNLLNIGTIASTHFYTTANVSGTGAGGALIPTGKRLGFDQSGVRSWTQYAAGGNLLFASGDGNGAIQANNFTAAGGNSGQWNTAYGWGNHASAGYTNDQTAAEILTAIKTVDGSGSGLDADLLDGKDSILFPRYRSVFGTGANKNWNTEIFDIGGSGRMHWDEVHNINTSWTNGPIATFSGAYTYGGVQSVYLGNQKYQMYVPHLAANGNGVYYRSGWGASQWYDWRVFLDSGNIASYAWTSSNDGSGSGLDADLLDGIQGAHYYSKTNMDAARNIVSGTNLDTDLANGGAFSSYGSGGTSWNAPFSYGGVLGWSFTSGIQGQIGFDIRHNQSAYSDFWFRGKNNLGFNPWSKVWHTLNDGSGSGLDADLLDGQQASAFAPIGGSTGRFVTGGLYGIGHSGSTLPIWQYNAGNPGYGIGYKEGSPDSIRFSVNNVLMSGTANLEIFPSETRVNGSAIWHAGNDGASSGLDADLLDGVQGSGYARLGGTDHLRSIPNRWFATADADNNIDHYTHAYAKAAMGLTYKYNTSRTAITTDTSYWVGTMGYGAIDMNTLFSYGSGDIDAWGNPANQPSGTSHWVGSQHLHYTTGSGGYGTQRVTGAGSPALTFIRGVWGGSFTSWFKDWNAANDGSGSGLDADYVDGVEASSFIRSDTADTFSGKLTMGSQLALEPGNYGWGLFGLYSSYRYQHVWSMGTGYNISDDGQSYGNMYGLTYTHTNVGTGTNQSISGLSHQLQHRHNGVLTAAIGSGIWTSGNVTAYSDIAVKTNLVRIPNALEKVCSINGYTYERTDYVKDLEDPEAPDILRQAGVVAQEIEKVLPEVVSGNDGNKAVAYGNIVALLIESIKELKDEVDELKKQLREK